MAINYKEELNPQQYEVVSKADGHALVLAGAGSGKTRTITYRVAYLIENGLAKPEEILLMTFTNKAAKEMLGRVNDLLGEACNIPGGTFHRMGNLFLRKYIPTLGYRSDFSILDKDDSQQLLNFCISDLGFSIKKHALPQIGMIQHMISYANNTQRPVRDVLLEYDFGPDVDEKLARIADRYKTEKKKINQLDFDDLLVLWLEVLTTNEKVAEGVSEKFKYILVDEYQDVNSIQAQLVQRLGKINKNILVVGDDAQSIYSFRAADVDNILSFPKHYSDAKIYKLEQNYRSSEDILALAQESIQFNGVQYQKNLEAAADISGRPLLVKVRDSKGQASFIAQQVKELQYDGTELKDIAILARSMYQTIDIQLALSNSNIPYNVRGGQKYFEQAHIKDILAFLKVIHNFKDEVAWRRLLVMFEGIGAKYAQNIIHEIAAQSSFEAVLNSDFGLRSAKVKLAWEKIQKLFKDIFDYWVDGEKYDLVRIVDHVYKSFYIKVLKDRYDKFEERSAAVDQFIDFSMRYNSVETLLTDITLDEGTWQKNKTTDAVDENKLVLSTIHQSKGLEWKAVFIANLYQGGFPHYKSIENLKDLQEERRLFYVSVTRAKENLYLMYPSYSMHYSYGEVHNEMSMFLEEIDDGLFDERTFIN